MNQQSVATIFVRDCIVCGNSGVIRYSELQDTLFGVSGVWNVFSCQKCSLLWLNPRPASNRVAELYKNYYTHEGLSNTFLTSGVVSFKQFPRNKKIKYAVLKNYFGYRISIPFFDNLLGILLGAFPSFRKKAELGVGGFPLKEGARLLDVGCGNGDYLLEMRHLGFLVEGIEIDPHAAEIGRSNGLAVTTGALLEGVYENESFDAIYLNNVIEHLETPEEIFRLCYSLLKKGGKLCIKTCSSESLAHVYFKESYRGLEIPRHFFIFSPKALRSLGKRVGFSVKKSYTTFNQYIWAASRAIKRGDPYAAYATENKILALLQKALVSCVIFFNKDKGDDIFILFEK